MKRKLRDFIIMEDAQGSVSKLAGLGVAVVSSIAAGVLAEQPSAQAWGYHCDIWDGTWHENHAGHCY